MRASPETQEGALLGEKGALGRNQAETLQLDGAHPVQPNVGPRPQCPDLLTMGKQRVFQRTLRMGGWFIQAEVSLIVLGKFPAVSVLFLSI